MGRILIIDDTPDLRTMLKDFLEGVGHEVLEAKTGTQGLEVIANECPDLVITDIIMPDMNGVDMMKNLRKTNKKLPVIVLSGYQEELAAVKRLGVYASIIKPPNLSELKNLVEVVMRKKSA